MAQWMGVHDDEALDFVLPNRNSFDMCNALFTDKDLFVDGTCQCVDEGGAQSTLCDDITYAPTLFPTGPPSASPTDSPSTPPTKSPTENPTVSPTGSPSETPTADLPDNGELVESLFATHAVTAVGCSNSPDLHDVFDGTTNKFDCLKTDPLGEPAGIIVTPDHRRPSIVKGLRVYAHNNCKGCDCVSYTLEGRLHDDAWAIVDEGDLPWKGGSWSNPDKDRNDGGIPVNSTYHEGDPSLTWTGVEFPSNSAVYDEYKMTCETRDPLSSNLRIGEVELTGMLLPAYPSASPTLSPSTTPTKSPSISPSTSPTKSPSLSPSVSPTGSPTADLPDNGTLVANILQGSAATSFGCLNSPNVGRVWDGTTNKYWCDRTGMHAYTTGLEFVTSSGQMTIPKAIRLYTANGCKDCDPREYILEGRVDAVSPWVEISSGDFPGIAGGLDRNAQGLDIVSTYEEPDPNLVVSEVPFPSHSQAFSEFKLTFVRTRALEKNSFQFAEIEIPGMILP